MPKAGQILYHKNFVYSDGTTGTKLVVVLNTCENTESCLVLKTTSQSAHYPYATPGCNSWKGMFCIYEECDQYFSKDTYVQMDKIYPINNVKQLLNDKKLSIADHLTEVCFKNLRKCLRNFREDIPKQYWSVIYSPN